MRPITGLEDGLNDLAVIRTTFETLEVFPGDADLQAEMAEIIDEARACLVRRLEGCIGQLEDAPPGTGPDADGLRRELLALLTGGYSRRWIDAMLKVDAFSGEEGPYVLDLPGLPDVETARALPARRLFPLFLRGLLENARNDACYASRPVFEERILQPYLALAFATLVAADPLSGGGERT